MKTSLLQFQSKDVGHMTIMIWQKGLGLHPFFTDCAFGGSQ